MLLSIVENSNHRRRPPGRPRKYSGNSRQHQSQLINNNNNNITDHCPTRNSCGKLVENQGLILRDLRTLQAHKLQNSSSSSSSTMTNSVRIKQEIMDSNPEESSSEQVLDLRKSSTSERCCTWCGKQNDPQNQGGHADFCSDICFDLFRRDSFKKRASCIWCSSSSSAQSNLTLNGATVDESKFCSPQCLTQFKVRVFCEETSAHLNFEQLKDMNLGDGGKGDAFSTTDLITPELWLKKSSSSSSSKTSRPLISSMSMRTSPNSSSSTASESSSVSNNNAPTALNPPGGQQSSLPNSNSSGGSSGSIMAALSRPLQSLSAGGRNSVAAALGSGSISTTPAAGSNPSSSSSSPLFRSSSASFTSGATTTTNSSGSGLNYGTGPPPRKRGRIPTSTVTSHQHQRSPVTASEYFPANLVGFNPSLSGRDHHRERESEREREREREPSSRSSLRRGGGSNNNGHHNSSSSNSRFSLSKQIPAHHPNIVSPSFPLPRMLHNAAFPLTGFPFPPHLGPNDQFLHPHQLFPTAAPKTDMGVNTIISYHVNEENEKEGDKKGFPLFKSHSHHHHQQAERGDDHHHKSGNGSENANDEDEKSSKNRQMLKKCSTTSIMHTCPCVNHHAFPLYPTVIPIPFPIPIPIPIPIPYPISSLTEKGGENSKKNASAAPSTITAGCDDDDGNDDSWITNPSTIQQRDQNQEHGYREGELAEKGEIIDPPSTSPTKNNNINNNNNNNNNCANHENSENNDRRRDKFKLKQGYIIHDIEEND